MLRIALFLLMTTGLCIAGQDWYHDRDTRYRGAQWRSQVFNEVRSDLQHVRAGRAADRERNRLDKTQSELVELQSKLDHGQFDNGILNDVIDSIAKSADDEKLNMRDRDVLHDDVMRLKDYQNNHNHWKR